MRLRLLWFALCLALILPFSACDKKEPYVASPELLIGQPLPKVRIQRLDVGPTNLKPERGRPAVIALWATWCEPCAEEIPALLRWHGARSDVDLLVLNVDSMDTDLNVIRKMAGELGLGAPLLATTPARASALGLRSLPLVIAVNERGLVQAASEGWLGEASLTQWLDAQFPAP